MCRRSPAITGAVVRLSESSSISPSVRDALAVIHRQALELIVQGAALETVLDALCDVWVANSQSPCKYPEGTRLAVTPPRILIRITLHSEHGGHDGVRAVDTARGSAVARRHPSTTHHAAIGV